MKKYIIIILSIFIMIFTCNDYFLYKDDVVKITNVNNKFKETQTNSLNLEEKYYIQDITGINKKNNKEVHLKNIYTTSNVKTEKYNIGDELIVKGSIIENLKRDKYVVFMILLFIISIYYVGKKTGILATLSVIINTILFYVGLIFYEKGLNIFLLIIIESILFSVISLFLSNGINKKTYASLISIFMSIAVLLSITIIISLTTKYDGISFNEINFLTVPVTDIFICELIIGGLGAIMDISITMSSSIYEIIEKNKKVTKKELYKSSKNIGNDVMSTMTNVLFFTYLSGSLPIFVLALRNGISLTNYITTNFSIEITRFLVGSIGILITIPIASRVSIDMFRKGDKHE